MTVDPASRLAHYADQVAGDDALDDINRAVARLLRLNASRSTFARSTAAAGVSLTHPAYLLLRAIVDHGPIQMRQVAELVHMDPGTAAKQVAKLVDADLVRRLEDDSDGRVSLVAATRRGVKAGKALTEVRTRHLSTSVAAWSEQDLQALATLLTRFVDDMASTSY